MPTSWSGKAVTRSGAERRTCRLSYRRSSANDCVGSAKAEFVVKSKYAAFAALDPFFDVIQRGLAGLVDGKHYFDTIADDAVFEFRYHFPGWPRRTESRDALMALYRGYGDGIVLNGADARTRGAGAREPRWVVNRNLVPSPEDEEQIRHGEN